jgi:ribosomal protein L16 Arg81 hydroxylase
MVCGFLQKLSLSSLVAPVADEEFRSRYWERQPLVVHRKDPDYYDGLFTLEDFEEAITRNPDYVKIANAATNKNASYKGVVTEGLEAVLGDMRAGSTLVLDQLHHREPKLGLLCRALAAELGHRFQTNLYLTPSSGKGFKPHWDNHDVFILQTVGSKNWKIEKQRRVFPGKNDTMSDEDRELRGDLDSFVLEQGDLIYIPRGFVHAAECGSEPSLHITLGVTAVFWEDLLYAAVRGAILQDERLRHALPLGFLQVPKDAIIKRLRGALREVADEAFLGGVVAQFNDELVRTYPLDVSDQILDFFRPRSLSIDDVVGARRAIVYQMHNGGDSVRINYGARAIVFPAFFREALEFALNRPAYVVREIPGDLADEERIAFAERLLEEGLVVRKEDGQIQ